MSLPIRSACVVFATIFCTAAQAYGQHTAAKPHLAPLMPTHVMGLRSLAPGQFMLSSRIFRVSMGTNHSGTMHIEPDDVLSTFAIAPISMLTTGHVFGAMVGLTNTVTASVMLPVRSRTMDHVARSRSEFQTSAAGVGDLRVGLRHIMNGGADVVYEVRLEVSLPVGSIEERDVTPASGSSEVVLPYPMQLGSGTIDLLPGAAIVHHGPSFSLGATADWRIQTGHNERGYRLGGEWSVSSWIGHSLWGRHGGTLTVVYADWDNISGEDYDLASQSTVVPTADPRLREGKELRIEPEFRFAPIAAAFGRHSLAVGAQLPLWHSFGGPQLGLSWSTHLTWSFMPGHDDTP